jgi:hypothetical protein
MLRAAGVSLDALAARFEGAHRDAIWRHWTKHVSRDTRAMYLAAEPLEETAARAAKEGGSLLSYLSLIRTTIFSQMLLAAAANDGHRTAVLAGRAIEALKEIGRLTGELSNISTLNVTNNSTVFVNSPMFARLEQMLLDRLRGFPDALANVVEGLRALENEAEPEGRAGALITVPAAGGFNASAA